ncbi:hypothetical protein ACQ4M4_13060 [Leptolyngbya sp. AN02str]|uniref:hypothetical protein n=1 Tax=Leptolyngbya sp. AN02str TaxID=3423363 RepID=UPI003D31339A
MLKHMISGFKVAVVVTVGLAIALSMGLWNTAIAAPLPASMSISALTQGMNPNLDVDKAAESAERASDQIYEGLEQTKQKIGKTEGRNEIIQKARDHASAKWEALADKARDANDTKAVELSPVDKHTLTRLQDSEP